MLCAHGSASGDCHNETLTVMTLCNGQITLFAPNATLLKNMEMKKKKKSHQNNNIVSTCSVSTTKMKNSKGKTRKITFILKYVHCKKENWN